VLEIKIPIKVTEPEHAVETAFGTKAVPEVAKSVYATVCLDEDT
jgi:hypothetical protein